MRVIPHMTDDWNWIPYAGARGNSDNCCCGIFAAQLVVWRMSPEPQESRVKAGSGLDHSNGGPDKKGQNLMKSLQPSIAPNLP